MKLFKAIIFSLILMTTTVSSHAMNIIRDAEIEEILTDMAQQIFTVAKLNPKNAKVYVINSSEINAFTIGNGYIFVNTGLLMQFPNAVEIMGILAHETAHIAAGHINRHIHILEQRSKNMIWSALAGLVGSALTGSFEVFALIFGYAATDEQIYLRFSRGEEFAADSLGSSYMEKLGYGAAPMIQVFDSFHRLEIVNGNVRLPTFIRSHPKPSDRISALRKKATLTSTANTDKIQARYQRALLKLQAFLNNDYDLRQTNNDYTKAVYYHRSGKNNKAIELLRNLLKQNPHDKYYKETLAQVLYADGDLSQSIKTYEEIYSKDLNPLIKIDYAKALIAAKQKIDFAIRMLEGIKEAEPFETEIFRLLGVAYGLQGRHGVADIHLAHEQMLFQNYPLATELLKRSLSKLNDKQDASYVKKAKYMLEIIQRANI